MDGGLAASGGEPYQWCSQLAMGVGRDDLEGFVEDHTTSIVGPAGELADDGIGCERGPVPVEQNGYFVSPNVYSETAMRNTTTSCDQARRPSRSRSREIGACRRLRQ